MLLPWLLVALTAAGEGLASSGSPPSRIVVIGGSVTEIVYALGAQDRLVARDSTSLYPAAALELPDIGYMRALSPEGVLSVEPDLILAIEGSGPPEAISVLKEAGVRFVEVPGTPYDRQGLEKKILSVAAALGREKAGAALAEKVDGEIAAAVAARPKEERARRVMFVLSVRGGRIMAAGKDTAAHGIIELAGGENVFDFSGYRPVSNEALLTSDPEIIVQMERGRHGPPAHASDVELFSMPAILQTTAGKNRARVRVDGLRALGFGPRTAEAVVHLAEGLSAASASEGDGAAYPDSR